MGSRKGDPQSAGGMSTTVKRERDRFPLPGGYISGKYWCYECDSSHPKGDEHAVVTRQPPGRYAVSRR